ncbi:prepilin-type N-terminal cleavage/methylation domain-containing protein [Fibrobacter sp. UWR2]|uniref:prepilin-type N-terminal cleavage/methylation domain-containing protein n=1 Tax=Fibrobacter sp. UWR2 TaxID=1964352 RepID=UPI000B529299|nr:prepilin-type N-terminal cleavage/methylation domain-containing protein [Fibrobacter sp. UWR2]
MSQNKDIALDKRNGFTLLEVLVALAVLAAGAVALGHYAGAFNRVSSAEIARADSAVAAVAYLDSIAVSLSPCTDTVLMRAETFLLPGPRALQWVEVHSGNFTLRRLVRCARASR